MSVSLLARQMSLPLVMAAHVGASPAHPTIPVTTACKSQKPRMRRCPQSNFLGFFGFFFDFFEQSTPPFASLPLAHPHFPQFYHLFPVSNNF